MANAYIYQAALLCADCANDVMAQTPAPHGVDPKAPNESIYDSDDWPKGPYADGGGEADCPQHCDNCNKFLENPLTQDGYAYVREQLDNATAEAISKWPLTTWASYYSFALDSNRNWYSVEMTRARA